MSTSGSRTAVAEQAGAKTQLTGLVGAALIVLMLVLRAGAAPQPAAADAGGRGHRRVAVAGGHPGHRAAVAAAHGRSSCCPIAAFLGVALLGVLPGIAIAVALSILNVFRRAWWPYETVLGRVAGIGGLPRPPAPTRTPRSCRAW